MISEQEKQEAAKQQLEKVGLSKNKRSQIVYDNYNALTEEQKEAVKNELLSRDYTEIEDGIFAENGRTKYEHTIAQALQKTLTPQAQFLTNWKTTRLLMITSIYRTTHLH